MCDEVIEKLERTFGTEDGKQKFMESYFDLIDADETDFIDDKTFRVHFKDGVNVDFVNEKIHLFEKEENLDAAGLLLSAAILKRAGEDMITSIIEQIS